MYYRERLEEEWISDKAVEMSKEVRESFTSNYVSEYKYGLDHKKIFNPSKLHNGEQLKRVQELLKKYGAYDFVDKNLLGYTSVRDKDYHKESCFELSI